MSNYKHKPRFIAIKPLNLVAMLVLCLFHTVSIAQEGGIVASIKPLHSLVAGVVGETDEAELLLAGNASPHGFQLKPSQMQTLQSAKIIFYIDDSFETFLVRAFETLPARVHKSAMAQTAELIMLARRKGGAWDDHDHDHRGHHEHKEHGHEERGHKEHGHEEHDHEEHGHEEHGHKEHGHEEHDHEEHGHEEHGHKTEKTEMGHHTDGDDDMHVWLAPANASAMIWAIAEELSKIYPENVDAYKKNANRMIKRIAEVDAELRVRLAPLKNKPFIVFHDAYQYFERTYSLKGVGSITFEPDELASPHRIKAMREKLEQSHALCVFYEPQFSKRAVDTVMSGTDAKSAMLDPLGAELVAGEEAYFDLLRGLADSLEECLG